MSSHLAVFGVWRGASPPRCGGQQEAAVCSGYLGLGPRGIRSDLKRAGSNGSRLPCRGLHDLMSRNSYFGHLFSLPAGNGIMENRLGFFASPDCQPRFLEAARPE